MNRAFSFHRLLIKPMIQDGPLIGMLKQCRNHSTVPTKIEEPFSIVDPNWLPHLDDSETSWINTNASCQTLDSGMILLKGYISVLGQVNIVNTCRQLGLGPKGFYVPSNRYGHKLRMHMMCLGRNWDPATGYEKLCRSDGSEPPPPPPLPTAFVHLARAVVEEAQAQMEELPSMCPDVCVANVYCVSGRLGLHQDCDESSDSLTRGLPVVSISIGGDAEFWYGHTRDVNKLQKVILKTGDALVFGGKSRLIFHGVKNIDGLYSSDSYLAMRSINISPGRLNLTFRQF